MHFANPAGVSHRNCARPLWLMATSLEKKFAGSQLANRATGSTPIPITPNTPGTMLTMASHTRNAAMVFGSVEHTATPSTMQATVNGNAAATP